MVMNFICKDCGKEISISDVFFTEDNEPICRECTSNYVNCSECGAFIKKSHDRYVCMKCDSKVYDEIVNSYGTKPIARFQNKNNIQGNLNNRYYGLEIEFSHLSGWLAKYLFQDLYEDKLIYNKSDSSLESGVEIVTNPCDKSSIRKLINRMSKGLEAISSIKNHDKGAGIHIHVNRKSISNIDIYKLSYMLNYKYNITQDERKSFLFLTNRITGRTRDVDDASRYCSVGSSCSLNKVMKGAGLDRHIALNLKNKNTIEFRMFKTSSSPGMIMFYIDLVDKMIDFVHNTSIKNVSITNFMCYLQDKNDSDILKKKLKSIKRYLDIRPVSNVFKVDYEYIDGIPLDKLDELLPYVKHGSSQLINLNLRLFKEGKTPMRYDIPWDEDLKETKVYNYVNERYRKHMIDKICNEYKELVGDTVVCA